MQSRMHVMLIKSPVKSRATKTTFALIHVMLMQL